MNSIKAFSIRKLKITAVLSVGIFVLLSNHEIYAEETPKQEKSEDVQNSISPEETEKYEEIIVSDEVITVGEDYDLTDNIVNGGQAPITDVIDITPAGSVNNEVPGQYTGTISVVLEDGSTQQVSVNIVIEATESEMEDIDEPEINDPELGDSEKDPNEELPSEEDMGEEDISEEDNKEETTEEIDKENETEAENPDEEDSKDEGTEDGTDEGTPKDSNIPEEEVEEDGTEDQDPTEAENTDEETETTEHTEEDAEQKTEDTNKEDFVDEAPTTEEDRDSEEDSGNSEADRKSQEEVVEETPEDTEVNDTSEEIEVPEIPQDRDDSEEAEESYDAAEEANGTNESDEEIIETKPHFTEIKESSKTDEYLSDYLSEEAAADIIGEIDIDFEKSSDEEIKQEITRSLLRYLSDMQRDQQYYAVTPPISRVLTKGGNSSLKDLDGLYPLNLDKQFNQGDFTIGDRLQWVAVADYTKQSPTPSSHSLYLLDGKNPLNHGHFEVKYVDGENFGPAWQVSLGAEHHLENVEIIFSPGKGPNGANWMLVEDETINIQQPEAFRDSQHMLVGKRFWQRASIENNISSYIDDPHTLQVNVKMLNAGEHLMFTVKGMALKNEEVRVKNHFIADARLTADLYM
jgi:hypothetical protein